MNKNNFIPPKINNPVSRKQPSQIKTQSKINHKERSNFVTIKTANRRLKQPVSTIELKICNNEFQIERKEADFHYQSVESTKKQDVKSKAKLTAWDSRAKLKQINNQAARGSSKSTSKICKDSLMNIKSQSIVSQNTNTYQKPRSNSFKRFDLKITTRKSKSVKAAREELTIPYYEWVTACNLIGRSLWSCIKVKFQLSLQSKSRMQEYVKLLQKVNQSSLLSTTLQKCDEKYQIQRDLRDKFLFPILSSMSSKLTSIFYNLQICNLKMMRYYLR